MTTDKYTQRMSGCGGCSRKLSAEWLNYIPIPMPKFVERSADEGKWHEARLIQELRDKGYIIENQQLEISIETPKYILMGHIEGTIKYPSDHPDNYLKLLPDKTYLFEIKSGSMYEFQRWMKGRFIEFPNYEAQITAYWEGAKSLFDLKGIVYLYKDRSGGYLDKQVLNHAPGDFNLIRAKLDAIAMSVANDVLYEADFDPSSIECKRCRFRDQICLAEKEQLTEATEKALLEAVKKCREGTALMNEGDALYKEGKKTLSNHCEAISPDKKYSFEINKMLVSRFPWSRTTYSKDTIESAFSEDVYKPLQKTSNGWTTKPTDLAKDYEENGE